MEWIWFMPLAVLVTCAAILLIIKVGALKRSRGSSKTNMDSIIGEKCVVTEKIDNFAGCGQIRVKGQIWSARGLYDEDEFDIGENLRIVAIEGVKVICKKKD